MRRMCALLFTGAAGSAFAADPAMIEAARKEGEVVWYTGFVIEQLARPLAENFEKAYGIKVNYIRANSADQVLRLVNEAKAGKVMADVFDGAIGAGALKQQKILAAFEPSSARHYPKELVDPDHFWTGVNVYVLAPAVNTELVSRAAEPKTWEDFLDPRWRGKLAWSSSMSAAGAPGFIATVLKEYGEEKGSAYLRKLAEQKIASIDGAGRAVTDQVIAGEYAIGLHIFNNQPAMLARAGAPIRALRIAPATATLNTVSVTAAAPHPNAARLLVEYLLSGDGQKVIAASDYVPADPLTSPSDPSLRPDGVTFRAQYFSPEELERGIGRWGSIYRDWFR
jgi:ABC-type Fe3+ transport system substrate-binding protein